MNLPSEPAYVKCGAQAMIAGRVGSTAVAECRLEAGHSHEHEVCLRFVPCERAEGAHTARPWWRRWLDFLDDLGYVAERIDAGWTDQQIAGAWLRDRAPHSPQEGT